jgi:diketogulonate reductase-like aldo/keto reductase
MKRAAPGEESLSDNFQPVVGEARIAEASTQRYAEQRERAHSHSITLAMTHATPGQSIRTISLPSGRPIPVLGQGTWHMAEDPSRRSEEIASLRLGIDLGLSLIDSAEMYADGEAERLVGEAIAGRRKEVFLVSKVLPTHARRRLVAEACERSLERLRTDHLDLYLLHWRGDVPLYETIDAFEALVDGGRILEWGVSNFDVSDMQELASLTNPGSISCDQVLYNLAHRGSEWDLMPWCSEHRIPIMAYSPIEQGRVLDDRVVQRIAERHGAAPASVAIAWVLRRERVCAIPKARAPEHVRENRAALDVQLTEEDLDALDREFPPPQGPMPLEMH